MIGNTRFLGGFGDTIQVAADGNHGFTTAPSRHPGGGYARDARFYGKTIVAQDASQVFGGFDFLESQFGKAEHFVNHDLGQFGTCLYFFRCFFFERFDFFEAQWLGLGRQSQHQPKGEEQNVHCFFHTNWFLFDVALVIEQFDE